MNKISMRTLGIVGNGFVGGAIARGFSLYANVKIYDKDPSRAVHSIEEACDSTFVFLCLPSPMMYASGGSTDLSIIESVCKQVSEISLKPIYILKSTVPVGTTRMLGSRYGIHLLHNPEFLTARNADIDFLTPARTILGGTRKLTSKVGKLYAGRFPGNNIIEMTSDESEAVKYIANCFFAVKVMYFNEVYLGLKEAYGLDWKKVMQGVLTDGRIGISHVDVPGHDGKLAFGGSCLPKDISSLISQIKKHGFDPMMIEACWEQNKKIRPEMDWSDIPGAVSKTNEEIEE